MINIAQITENFNKLAITEIGKKSGFIKLEKKLTALNFILSFFESFSDGSGCQTTTWVQNLSTQIGIPLSKQGFTKRIGWRCVSFCTQILAASLTYSLQKATLWHCKGTWMKSFNRIFLEDSTCLKLPKILYDIYGGNANEKGTYAVVRIQLRMLLGSERIENIAIRGYGETDVKFSDNILSQLRRGDLIIRDLGYSVIDVFATIQSLGAFFISRWHPHTRLCSVLTKQALDLGKMLGKASREGVELIDTYVLLGLQKQFQVRIIAIKVPIEVEKKRRQNVEKRKKDKGIKYSESYYEHLGWSIYITNLDSEKLKADNIWAIYGLRWRIEIIFKAWKSHLNIANNIQDMKYLNPCQIIVRLYLMMAWIVLCLVPAYNYFAHKIFQSHKRHVSLAKFADYYRNNFESIVNEINWDRHTPFIIAFCLYDKRKKYQNYFENLYMINLC